MAINPETTTTVKVSELASAGFNTTDLVPHEVGGYLKKGTLQDLATFIGGIISTEGSVAFKAVHITDGQTLPATTTEEFILVGPGTYPNVGGGSPITTTEPLSALVSNGTYWYIGVEIPITASGTWGAIAGELSDQIDLQDALDLKADLVGGKVPSSQLPSYVDDVVEVANYAALPSPGETGKIYITLDTNKIYRWSGSTYILIASNSGVWGAITGTLSDQTDLNTALGLKVPYTGATGNVDLGSHTLSSYNLVVNHTSGSGTAATISKGGNGEALTVTKSSGSGNAASITGGTTLISQLNLSTALADAYIASASTWNAKIGGSGTTNYIPKFTGSTAIGNSLIYDNGTNVGIGTTSPVTKGQFTTNLNGSNPSTFTDILTIGVSNGVSGSGKNNIGSSLVFNGIEYFNQEFALARIAAQKTASDWQGFLTFHTNGGNSDGSTAERMRITSGGNVGIGTSSPSGAAGTALAINGGAGQTRIALKNNFTGDNPSDGFQILLNAASADVMLENRENGYIGFTTNDTERMRIAANGAITATSTITASAGFFNSDMRLKDLTEYDYNVSDIKAISYFWKDGRDSQKHIGYSAQEVQKVMPDAVNEGTDGMLSVNYVEVLVAKIAELENRIKQLEK